MSATALHAACLTDAFPDLATVTKFGLDGYGGTNPIAIFSCYKSAINGDGVTVDDINHAYEHGELNKLILENSHSVKYNKYYEPVCQKGGIKLSSECTQLECDRCNRCAVHEDGICSNCGNSVKNMIL
jgi:hypothetical protein